MSAPEYLAFHVLENLLGQAVSLSGINLFQNLGIVRTAQHSGKSF
jgi:hypothetical protein